MAARSGAGASHGTYFADADVSTEFVAKLRWPHGPVCARCGVMDHSYLSTRRVWKCKGCKKQYSVKLGTIFEDSPLGLDKWLPAIWLIANSKNGISSHELARSLGTTQKSAWFMLHRIRLAMQTGSFDKHPVRSKSTRPTSAARPATCTRASGRVLSEAVRPRARPWWRA